MNQGPGAAWPCRGGSRTALKNNASPRCNGTERKKEKGEEERRKKEEGRRKKEEEGRFANRPYEDSENLDVDQGEV